MCLRGLCNPGSSSPACGPWALTYMELAELALVQHFSKLRHCAILTFDHLVQLLGLKMREDSTPMLAKCIQFRSRTDASNRIIPNT